MKNYLIVGGGIAGIALAHQMEHRGLSFDIADDSAEFSSSKVAAGYWNPIVFKRLTSSYRAGILLPHLQSFYAEIEQKIGVKFMHEVPMLKIFSSKEERHRFIDKAMVSEVSQFLDEDIVESIDGIVAPFGMGKVIDTGYIDTRKYIGASLEHFGDGGSFIDARVTHSEIEYGEGYLSYGGRRYERVIFCEGYHAMENPLFAELRLKPAKGELLKVKIAGLTQEWAIAKGVGLIPIGEQSFIVGSTYNWEDRTEATTAVAKDYLLERLGELLDLDYEVVGHEAGIRPSSFDRRPILGQSRVWNGAYIFNGLGTKGIMYAPYYADMLLGNIEDGKAIDEEVDYARML